MSASREKKDRKAPVSAASEQTPKSSWNKLAAIIVAVVVVLLIASIVFLKGPFLKQYGTAVTAGEHKLSPVMVRYYYSEVFNNFLSNYNSLANYMFESTEHIEQQVFDEESGETWGDYFMDSAIEQIKVTYATYDEATRNNFSLSEKEETSIDSTLTAIKTYAKYYNVTENAYVESLYGPGSSVKTLEEYLRVNAIANAYQNTIKEGFSYSESELSSLYESAPDAYNSYTYHSYYVSGAAGEDEDQTQKMAEAEENAQLIVDAASSASSAMEKLDNYLISISTISGNDSYLDGTTSLHSDVLGSAIDGSYHDWVVSEEREEGDVELFNYQDTGYYVVFYVGTNTNDYATVNARVIPINVPSNDEEGWANALEQKTAMEEDLNATDDWSDEFFNNLSYAYSDDESSMYSGGLYENISKANSFSGAVSAWLFSEGRSEGDWDILLTDNGYCFVYFVSSGESYRNTLLDAELRSTDYSTWFDDTTNVEDPIRNESGMKRVVTDLSYSAS